MSLKEAEVFIQRIFEKTGRYPLLYANHQVLTAINTQYDANSAFAKCPFWYARFREKIPHFDTKIWSSYFLWQFSCEINCQKTGSCLYNVPGTRFDMDVNVFYGSYEALKMVWLGLSNESGF
jgi:lysozyme